jgi:hypothetical protein
VCRGGGVQQCPRGAVRVALPGAQSPPLACRDPIATLFFPAVVLPPSSRAAGTRPQLWDFLPVPTPVFAGPEDIGRLEAAPPVRCSTKRQAWWRPPAGLESSTTLCFICFVRWHPNLSYSELSSQQVVGGCGGTNAPHELGPARRDNHVPRATLAAVGTISSTTQGTCITTLAAAHTR